MSASAELRRGTHAFGTEKRPLANVTSNVTSQGEPISDIVRFFGCWLELPMSDPMRQAAPFKLRTTRGCRCGVALGAGGGVQAGLSAACGTSPSGGRRRASLSGSWFRSQLAVIAIPVPLANFCSVSARSLFETRFGTTFETKPPRVLWVQRRMVLFPPRSSRGSAVISPKLRWSVRTCSFKADTLLAVFVWSLSAVPHSEWTWQQRRQVVGMNVHLPKVELASFNVCGSHHSQQPTSPRAWTCRGGPHQTCKPTRGIWSFSG